MKKIGEILEVMDQEIFRRLDRREQARFMLFIKPNLTRYALACRLLGAISAISARLSSIKSPSSVKTTKSVASSSKYSNYSNYSSLATLESKNKEAYKEVRKKENLLFSLFDREIEEGFIDVNKGNNPQTYCLTSKGNRWAVALKRSQKEQQEEQEAEEERKRQAEQDVLDASQRIRIFKEFIEKEYLDQLQKNHREDKKHIEIDFRKLTKYNPELAEYLLDDPEETIKAAEISISEINEKFGEFAVKLCNISKSAETNITNLRAKDLGKLKTVVAEIRSRSKEELEKQQKLDL